MLDKMLGPGARGCTPAVAPQRAALQADALTQTRIDERAEPVNEGERTEAEQREDEAYGEMIALLGLCRRRLELSLPPLPLRMETAVVGQQGRGQGFSMGSHREYGSLSPLVTPHRPHAHGCGHSRGGGVCLTEQTSPTWRA